MGNHVVLAFLCGEVSYYWFTLLTINQSIHVFFLFFSDTFWIGCMFVFFSNFIFLFFNFTILYWFCHISTWIHHRYICVPHPEPSSLLPPHTIPLGHPSAPAPCIQYRALNLDWRLVSYVFFKNFSIYPCYSSLLLYSFSQ